MLRKIYGGASMGPRSCERGNSAPIKQVAGKVMLQWGRARASAEMTVTTPKVTPSAMLQWGRARASAEIAVELSGFTSAVTASMGPRSCERGNSVIITWSRCGALVLQWGRARASAEIS